MLQDEYIQSDEAYSDIKSVVLEMLDADSNFRSAFCQALKGKALNVSLPAKEVSGRLSKASSSKRTHKREGSSRTGLLAPQAPAPLPVNGRKARRRKRTSGLSNATHSDESSGSDERDERVPPLPADDDVPQRPPLPELHQSRVLRTCSGCHQAISVDCKHFEVGSSDDRSFWHVECFTCADCGLPLAALEFKTHDGTVYCAPHFAARFCPKCGGCGQPITTEVFSVALGQSWHPGHFACVSCKKGLTTDFVSDEQQRPFCDADCFANFEGE